MSRLMDTVIEALESYKDGSIDLDSARDMIMLEAYERWNDVNRGNQE